MNLLQTAVKPLEETIIAQIENYVVANKPAIVAKLKDAGVNVIEEVGAIAVAKFNEIPALAPLDAEVATIVASGEQAIIDALGGPEEALYALVIHELDTLKQSGIF